MRINIKEPCVAAKPFAGYREGDRISPTSYWRLRKWARKGWVKNCTAEAPDEQSSKDSGDTPPVVKAYGGGWYTVEVDGEITRYQGKTALEEAGYEAPDG